MFLKCSLEAPRETQIPFSRARHARAGNSLKADPVNAFGLAGSVHFLPHTRQGDFPPPSLFLALDSLCGSAVNMRET